MKTQPKTLEEFETMYSDKLANDIINTQGHIVKLTARLNNETNDDEKNRLAALLVLHNNHKTKLSNTDSTIVAAEAKAKYDERVSKYPEIPNR
jgi:hypothetical protein